MRPAPNVARARRTTEVFRRLALVTAVAMTVAGGLSGCLAVTSGRRGPGPAQLVRALAARLTRCGGRAYTAPYRPSQGSSAPTAQAATPSRVGLAAWAIVALLPWLS